MKKKRVDTGYSNRMETVTPRTGAAIPDGSGRYLVRGDIVAADSEIAKQNRGMFMRAPEGSKITPTSERADTDPNKPEAEPIAEEAADD